jgi:hypothetical protein
VPQRAERRVGYHGTSLSAAFSLLNGAELRLEVALAQKIDGPPVFYLADEPDVAAFFAVRRAPGAVLKYAVSAAASAALLNQGATVGLIPQGAFPAVFPGRQFVVPPAVFRLFNRLRRAGAITVTPHGFG